MQLFCHGKLLLTSEYVVLSGALALAIPTRWGQSLDVEIKEGGNTILWEAYHQNELWLSLRFSFRDWKIIETNRPENADFIIKVFKALQEMNPNLFELGRSYAFKTNLEFPSNYGLGSSSTLITNLAQWAMVDAYQLNEKCLGGSGYDIAVAKEGQPILYQLNSDKRNISVVDFNPSFKNDLIFIHLNQKQDSREGIRLFKSREKTKEDIDFFTRLTKQVVACEDLEQFSKLMTQHEEAISQLIGLKPIKDRWLSDCPSFVKSLGAWGGDFVMASKFKGYKEYFQQKGFSTIYDYKDLIN